MNIHEYQAKEVLAKHGVAVPKGMVVDNPDKAEAAARELGTDVVVVKAQIHAGGRGKGGGVKLAKSPGEAKTHASKIIGMTLVTPQTGSEGRKVKKVLIEEGMPIAKELYLGILLDRQSSRVMIMASEAGGMAIEEVAEETPEKIIKELVDPIIGVKPYLARKIAFALNLEGAALKQMIPLIINLYKAFIKEDCDMLEINPLVITKDDRVLVLDAKAKFPQFRAHTENIITLTATQHDSFAHNGNFRTIEPIYQAKLLICNSFYIERAIQNGITIYTQDNFVELLNTRYNLDLTPQTSFADLRVQIVIAVDTELHNAGRPEAEYLTNDTITEIERISNTPFRNA